LPRLLVFLADGRRGFIKFREGKRQALASSPGPPLLFLAGMAMVVWLDLLFDLRSHMEVNTYYYVYSTISQTLASAFGFLVAVGLFLFQSLERYIQRHLAEVIDHIVEPSKVNICRRMNDSHFWDIVDGWIDKSKVSNIADDDVKTHVDSSLRNYKEARKQLGELKVKLVSVLFLTSGVVTASLISIPLSRLLTDSTVAPSASQNVAFLLIYCITFMAVRCLWFYCDIARRLTTRQGLSYHMTAGTGRPAFYPPSSAVTGYTYGGTASPIFSPAAAVRDPPKVSEPNGGS